MKPFFKYALVTIITIAVSCQTEPKGCLEMNAIIIDNPREIHGSTISRLADFDAILLGELHGTNKSADLVFGLASKMATSHERVQNRIIGNLQIILRIRENWP